MWGEERAFDNSGIINTLPRVFSIPLLTELALYTFSFLLKCCTHPPTGPTFTLSANGSLHGFEKIEAVKWNLLILLSSTDHLSYVCSPDTYNPPIKMNTVFLPPKAVSIFLTPYFPIPFITPRISCCHYSLFCNVSFSLLTGLFL